MRVKDAVATCLTEAAGQYLSGETLAQKLGVSRNAVWKAVRLLQEEGFPIEAKKKTGYRLAQGIDLLTEETVRPYLHSRILGHPLYVYPELPSTNNTCKALVRDGAKHGTVVAANCQTAGKGRQGRTFVSPAGSGLYFSMILSKAVSLQDAPLLTACAAVAAARAIDALYSTQVQIKWVNDLYLHGKKFCGILTEGGVSLESGKLEHAIIGIGINIRNTGGTAAHGDFTGRIHAGHPRLSGAAAGGGAVRDGAGAPGTSGAAFSDGIPQPFLSHRADRGAGKG